MGLSRIVIGGAQSGVGKTSVSVGIMRSLVRRGLNVQPYKVGPDYIDPAFHHFVTGNRSRNLDSWMVDENAIKDILIKGSKSADISIIEGVMGLYDGFGTERDMGSTAHVSKLTKSPVILIIDGSGMSSSAAAQVLGYKEYDKDVGIKGVIVNKLSGESHYKIIKEVIERDTGIKCVGYLKKNLDISLKSRHLGLIPSVEVDNLNQKLDELANMVEETIDVESILNIAKDSQDIGQKGYVNIEPIVKNINIGVASDKAFNFYYQDNLELLESLGANLIYFSPLEDRELPKNLHGLYIGGGFPEVFVKELEKNQSIRKDIKSASIDGMPIYAECGGLMYLSEKLSNFEGEAYEMVGIFNKEAIMTKRLQRFGYVEVNINNPCAITKEPTMVKAHEFHRSKLIDINENEEDNFAYEVKKIRGNKLIKSWSCGLIKKNTLGAYAHIHFYANKQLAIDFINNCREYKEKGCGQ